MRTTLSEGVWYTVLLACRRWVITFLKLPTAWVTVTWKVSTTLYIRTGDCADEFYFDRAQILTVFNSGVCNDGKIKGSQNVTVTSQPNNFSIDARGNYTASVVISALESSSLHENRSHLYGSCHAPFHL
jgi:hypothetical protein